MSAFDHLHPQAAALLMLDPQTRVQTMRDQRFVPYPAGMSALRWLRYYKNNAPSHDRPRSLHLIGAAGMGKSRILRHYAGLHGQAERDSQGHRARSVVLVEMRNGDFRVLCSDLIHACLPGMSLQRSADYLSRLGPSLQACGVRQILIDEAGNLLMGGKQAQQQCLVLFKSLTNMGITICIATTENMKAVLAADEQLYSRFKQLRLPHWTESQEFRQFLKGVEAQLPLPEPSNLSGMQIVRWLVSHGYTVTASILDLIYDSAARTILAGLPRLTLEILKETAESAVPPDGAV